MEKNGRALRSDRRAFLQRALVGAAAVSVGGFAAKREVSAGQPQGRANLLRDIPVVGTLPDGSQLEGLLSIGYVADAGDGASLLADGLFSYVDTAGESVVQVFSGLPFDVSAYAPMASVNGQVSDMSLAQGTCSVLYLTIAPIFLDLLGLVLELPNPLVIDLRAELRPCNLRGSLLCAIAGMLHGTGGLSRSLQGLLDRINELLSGLLGSTDAIR